jgi:tetratricopeptide (TPR) repeat protein
MSSNLREAHDVITIEECLVDLEGARLMTHLDVKPKHNLATVCEQLRTDFKASQNEKQQDDPTGFIFSYNMGALMHFHYGDFDRAGLLCHRAIEICQMFAARNSDPRWVGNMIQPYINLGRLAAVEGRRQTSLRIYEEIFALFNEGRTLTIDGFAIPASMLHILERDEPSLRVVSRNVYVLDSLRALLIDGDYLELMRFIDRVEEPVPHQRLAMMEAQVMALSAKGEFADALHLAKELVRNSIESGGSPAIYILVADIYRRCDKRDDAKKILDHAERCMGHVAPKTDNRAEVGYMFYRLALCRYLIHDLERSHLNANTALAFAQVVDDEVGILKILILLVKISQSFEGGDPSSWCRQLAATAGISYYRIERAIASLQLADVADLLSPSNPESTRNEHLTRAFAAWRNLKTKNADVRAGEVEELIAFLGDRPDNSRDIMFAANDGLRHPNIDSLYDILMEFEPAVHSPVPSFSHP